MIIVILSRSAPFSYHDLISDVFRRLIQFSHFSQVCLALFIQNCHGIVILVDSSTATHLSLLDVLLI